MPVNCISTSSIKIYNQAILYQSSFRVKHPIPDFEDYFENKKKYCPNKNDDICEVFKIELEKLGMECMEDRAARLKQYLQWKCENENDKKEGTKAKKDTEDQESKLYPEHDLLPEYIRPNSYEIWLWIHKEPIIKGNIKINVTVNE